MLRRFNLTFGLLVGLLISCGAPSSAPAQPTATPTAPATALIFPRRAEDNSHEYYQQLLEQALAAIGQNIPLEMTEPLPQTRAVQMLDNDQISLFWMIRSAERDQKYVPVEVDLTNGLIGQRILLIRPADAARFAQVQSVADLQQQGGVGAFGKGWFDAKVWAYNELPYTEVDGDWSVIYGMLANGGRGIDYFSRGFTEVRADATQHPELLIEDHLLLVYARDFRFYLAPSAAHYKPVLEEALTAARDSGLMETLIRNFWAEDFAALKVEQRLKLELATPP